MLDFVKSYTEVGLYGGSFSIFMSLDKWNALSVEAQEAIMSVSGSYLTEISKGLETLEMAAVEEAVAMGLEIVPPSEALLESLRSSTVGFQADWVAQASALGIDAEAALAFYKEQLGIND